MANLIDPADLDATLDYVSPVPLWSSGAEAAEHGMADVENPGDAARSAVDKLARRMRSDG
jgi:hypothetical protein